MDDGLARIFERNLKESLNNITEKLEEMDIQGDGNGISHVIFTTLSATSRRVDLTWIRQLFSRSSLWTGSTSCEPDVHLDWHPKIFIKGLHFFFLKLQCADDDGSQESYYMMVAAFQAFTLSSILYAQGM